MAAQPLAAKVTTAPAFRPDGDAALRAQRDRFVGFAFAAADLVLEIDRSGVVSFASGAGRRLLGVDSDRTVGRKFVEFVAADDKPLVGLCFYSLQDGDRLDPVRLSVLDNNGKVRASLLGACRIPGRANSLYVALTMLPAGLMWPHRDGKRDPATGLLDTESFIHAADLITRGNAGANASITLLELDGSGANTGEAGTEGMAMFLQGFGRLLRVRSLGDVAGSLGNGRYGVVHDRQWDPREIDRSFRGLQGGSLQGPSMQVNRTTIEADSPESKRLADMIRCFAATGTTLPANDATPAATAAPAISSEEKRLPPSVARSARRRGEQEVWG